MARGQEAAFVQLYAQYHSRLLRLAIMLGRGDDYLAQDAVQAAFVIAAAKLRAVEGADHLWNWLAQIVRQQIVKADRRQPVDGFAGIEELSVLTGRETDSRLEEIVDAALQALEPDERVIIERFYFDRLSHKQLAEELQVTTKAVSSRLERARAKLRALINQQLSHEA
jgi:RNA polymerase sigma-70 factor (ECF subfamily)